MDLMTAKEAKATSKKNQDARASQNKDESMKWIIEKIQEAVGRGAQRISVLGCSPSDSCYPCFQEGTDIVIHHDIIAELVQKKYVIHSSLMGSSNEKGLYPIRITITWE
jgi:hypothetical protein